MPSTQKAITLKADIAIIGGSTGGVAAALAALEQGCGVILTEATDWLGGQLTSQGVSALDEHKYIETFGGTRTYNALRGGIRKHYQTMYGLAATMSDGSTPLNPGNGWVSRLCFEPKVAVDVIDAMLAPFIEAGKLQVLIHCEPVSATQQDGYIQSITLKAIDGQMYDVHARYVLDATDLGDVLPLTQTAYVTGAEAQADTGEPHAKAGEAVPNEVQGFTYGFVLEHRPHKPRETHTIPKPANYERFKQQYSFTLEAHSGNPKTFSMFAGNLSFWRYRRLIDANLLQSSEYPNDLALINWASNDYYAENLIDQPKQEQARILQDAKELSLGFLYWLQTEAPRDEGGFGYPELKLRPDVMASDDGLSKAPYIRESRRIVARERVLEQHITPSSSQTVRAKHYANSVGIGWYAIDLHPCVGNPHASTYAPTLPFQLPLGALIPKDTHNLLAACKNIGTTHLTNGAYRVHPCEWAVGEAAGHLAAFCCRTGYKPAHVWANDDLTRQFQAQLVKAGVPLAWTVDVPQEHLLFAGLQRLAVLGGVREEGLELLPHLAVDRQLKEVVNAAYQKLTGKLLTTVTSLEDVARALIKSET
ncbi:MAG: FAD-dependent oxidoreductase [Deinococcota bacterium]